MSPSSTHYFETMGANIEYISSHEEVTDPTISAMLTTGIASFSKDQVVTNSVCDSDEVDALKPVTDVSKVDSSGDFLFHRTAHWTERTAASTPDFCSTNSSSEEDVDSDIALSRRAQLKSFNEIDTRSFRVTGQVGKLAAGVPIKHRYGFLDSLENDPRFEAVIFDIGDVLVSWDIPKERLPIPPLIFHHISRSKIWFDYEKGLLTTEEAYRRLAAEYNHSYEDIAHSFTVVKSSLVFDSALFELIKALKASGRRVFAMSNITEIDCEYVASVVGVTYWNLLDGIFTSSQARSRKPHLDFYKYTIEKAGINPYRTVFIDDKLENVLSARSFGMKGLVYRSAIKLFQDIRNLCCDPVKRGQTFLDDNKKELYSLTSDGCLIVENYSQRLILELTGQYSLVDIDPRRDYYVSCAFPEDTPGKSESRDDVDDIAIGLMICPHLDEEEIHKTLNEILRSRTLDGLIPLYLHRRLGRPKIDICACVNVLSLFASHNRLSELGTLVDWIRSCLEHRVYLEDLSIYSMDAFFYFLSRLIRRSDTIRNVAQPLFRQRLSERLGSDGDSLALAMRIIAAAAVNLVDDATYEKLLSMQREDGSWADSWYYRDPRTSVTIGNDGLATAMAVAAISEVRVLKTKWNQQQ